MLPDIALPLLLAPWSQKRDLVAQKVEQTIKINATAIVCPQPIELAVNPLKSNLIRNHWCGSKIKRDSN